MPKEQETALSDEWSSFVKQLAFVGTRNDHKIDDMYKPAMLELHALLQLVVDLEAEHESTVTLPLKPPIYFTVDYSGISDEPSQQDADQVMVTDHQSSSHETGLPPHPPGDTEHLFKVAGASVRTYTFTNEGPSPRPPPYERGRSFSRGRGGFGRGQQWNQQLSYYSAESSRGGGSSIARSASPYRSSDSRRNVTEALERHRDRRLNPNSKPHYMPRQNAKAGGREASRQTPSTAVSTTPPVHKRKEWLPKPARTAVE